MTGVQTCALPIFDTEIVAEQRQNCFIMDDDATFEQMLLSMRIQNKRDPRSIRLAAVTAAIVEIVGEELSPTKVYASTVTTLEGTLKLEGSDSLSTQVALLELLRLTIPHVSPAAVVATLPVSSRVLRAVVASCQSVGSENIQETKDELGGINATLRSACRAVVGILSHLTLNASEKVVTQLFHGTLLSLFDDRRPKVRKAAQNGCIELLMGQQCHPAIQLNLTAFACKQLERARHGKGENTSLLHLLSFLERAIITLDLGKIGGELMELLMVMMQVETSSTDDFVASFRKDATFKILLINAIVAVLIVSLEENDFHNTVKLDTFTSRVLASVLQVKPSLVFRSADFGILATGRALFGRLILIAESRVIKSNPTVGLKLLPLSIQMGVQLSRPTDEHPATEVAQAIMVELTKLFREQIGPLVESGMHSSDVDLALRESLRGMEQVLQLTFRPTWSVALQPLAYLLQLMPSHVELPDIVESLIKLRIQVASDDPSRQAVEEAVSSMIQGLGIESFWEWISWEDAKSQTKSTTKESVGAISINRAWLLPLLKSSSMAVQTKQPHLAFFQQEILGLARKCDAFAVANPSAATFHQARVTDLWSLLPCFGMNPADLQTIFPNLSQTLVRAMGDARYPQLISVICGGLKTIATGVLERREMNDEGRQQAQVVSELTPKLLPSLFKLVETLNGTSSESASTPKDDMDVEEVEPDSKKNVQSLEAQQVQCVTEAIAELSRLAPKPYLQGLFKKVMQRLLAATQSDKNESEKICTFLGLSQALVSSEALDETSISLLYRALKPLIRSDEHESRVQKKAYKVMVEICSEYPKFVTEPERLIELTELLVGSIMTCQVSARHMRLKCMALIVNEFDFSNTQQMDIVPKAVGEVLLCLKDSNAKTREAAYQLLLKMGTKKENMTEYFHIVMAALGAQTPHMRSAAVMAMSRLVFEYARNDPTVHALLPSLLQTIIVLFAENSREVIKSVVGFVRVSVAAMTPAQLEPTLPDLLNGLLKYHKGKDRFRAKIKIILKKLVRVYGYDKLMPMVPASDTRLLTHMRKLSDRVERRKADQKVDGKAEKADFEDMMESDEDDSDDGRTLMTGATGFTKMTGRTGKTVRTAAIERSEKRSMAASSVATSRTGGKQPGPRLKKDDGEVLDMLDPSMTKSVRFAEEMDDNSDSDGGAMEFDDHGRLVVPDDLAESVSFGQNNTSKVDDDSREVQNGGKKRKLNKFDSAKVARDGKKKENSNNKKKAVQSLGAAYKSKKSGGDVMKKGQKFEPYAYMPLDGKSYTKKNRRGAVEKMATVVRGGAKRKR